ncbi:MAG: efflux RND transporter periplasmic adaptor subunit, partial [Gammaproteobacteria bacterium]|nr:efflux RND transporter periplasmic adaptor subunit [Gammaproteobacteria bacterium]
TQVELGDYLQLGGACATIVDLDPMLLVGQIAEKTLHRVHVGESAYGDLATGETVSGLIRFIAQQADPVTRTYRVEVEISNADYAIRSGITTKIRIPAETVLAHKVSPALFALDDFGAVGVRTLDGDNRVEFHLVDIVRDDVDGVWITGLPERTTLITVGQEFVVPGEVVNVQFETNSEIPVVAPRATRPSASFPDHPVQPLPTREDRTEAGLARAS